MITRGKNSKAITVVVILLLLANIVGLIFFWLNKPSQNHQSYEGRKENAMQGYLKDELHFSSEQLVAYDSLAAKQRRYMSAVFDTMRQEKERRLRYVVEHDFADTAVSAAVAKTAVRQQAVESRMLLYLKEVRELCTAAQQQQFDSTCLLYTSRCV